MNLTDCLKRNYIARRLSSTKRQINQKWFLKESKQEIFNTEVSNWMIDFDKSINKHKKLTYVKHSKQNILQITQPLANYPSVTRFPRSIGENVSRKANNKIINFIKYSSIVASKCLNSQWLVNQSLLLLLILDLIADT